MDVKLVYLDSSGMVKRYIAERGSEVLDLAFEEAEAMNIGLAFSVWNIGEVLGVFDRYASRALLSKAGLKTALSDFLSESVKMARLGALQILPLTASSIISSWLLVLKHHIYEADALQIAVSKELECSLFLSADNRLVKIAGSEGLKALDVESDRAIPILKELSHG